MKITVKLFGTLRSYCKRYKHTSGIELETDSEIKVSQVIEQLKFPVSQVGIVTINGKLVKAEDTVPEGAEVKVFQPLAGG